MDGHSDKLSLNSGRGIAILDHGNTFDDSSCATDGGFDTDDFWRLIQLDGAIGRSNFLVTAMDLSSDIKVLGTKELQSDGGSGIRLYDPAAKTWKPLRTADHGLPSNEIFDIAYNEAEDEVWVSTQDKGIARYDGQTWQSWEMFGQGSAVTTITLEAQCRAGAPAGRFPRPC